MKKSFLRRMLVAVAVATLLAVSIAPYSFIGVFAENAEENQAELECGEEIEITVSVDEYSDIKAGSISFEFDTDTFEIVSGEWLISGCFMIDFDPDTGRGVFAFRRASVVGGDVFRLILRVKDEPVYGDTSVTATARFDNSSGVGALSDISYLYAVVCEHTFGGELGYDDNEHWISCSKCNGAANGGKTEVEAHAFDNTCDTSCDVCGLEREITHTVSEAWESNANEHFKICSVCGERQLSAGHIPSAPATETSSQSCTVCGYMIAERLTHEAVGGWLSDDLQHWHGCKNCNGKLDAKEHEFNSIVSAKPTENSVGERVFTCKQCGFTASEPISAPPVMLDKPDAEAVWEPQSGETVSFRSDAPMSEFVGVKVDGADVAAECYTVREGSTVVELKAEYLATLADGEHTVTICSQSGDASASFRVKNASDDAAESEDGNESEGADQNGDFDGSGGNSQDNTAGKTENGAGDSAEDGGKGSVILAVIGAAVLAAVIITIVCVVLKKKYNG